jgi:hypothetical protein
MLEPVDVQPPSRYLRYAVISVEVSSEDSMNARKTIWIHQATFTYRLDQPERTLETLWVERPGWGYIKRRDMWIPRECTPEEASAEGLVLRKPLSDPEVHVCPYCSTYVASIPGALLRNHFVQCGGNDEDWAKIEETIISDQRRKQHEDRVLAAMMRARAEQEEMEKRARFDKIREDQLARQLNKDRKKRLKEQTRKELRDK